jgi:hypothetical protein
VVSLTSAAVNFTREEMFSSIMMFFVFVFFFCICRDISDEMNDHEESSSSRPGRMTRQRTRGAAATVCYLEDDEDDLYFSRKRKPNRKPVEREKHVEKQQRNEERIEKPLAADKDRESNIDENSLYYIVRHSRSATTVRRVLT